MRLVVTGREGQVARSLIECAPRRGVEVVPLGRSEIDLAGAPAGIEAAIAASRPDILVSAAAYTQVDKAENEPELAFAVNEAGARAVARAARKQGVPLIHLSTDYVFDGAKQTPYVESDPTGPTGVYGASKLAGERAVLAEGENCAILRTAWVYSPFGTNFVKTMLRLAADREEIGVVGDQHGNPTSAFDIAAAILSVAASLVAGNDPAQRGIFHMTASGDASWAEFAEAIFAASTEAGGPSARVNPIASADYPTAARRPANSRLDSAKLEQTYGLRLPKWDGSMKLVVERLLEEGRMRSVE